MRQYIGARYTTKIYQNSLDPGSCEWESGVIYEPLTIVSYQNSSYLSRTTVPANSGAPTVATQYWAQTGFYNGQIAQLQNDVAALQADMEGYINRIAGKQIAVYGDSWSSGSFAAWVDLLSTLSGNTVHNYSANGKKMVEIDSTFDDYDADIYIIEAMINDWNDSILPNTFGSAVTSIISKIRAVNSMAEIYFITMPAFVNHSDFPALAAIEYYPLELYRQIVWNKATKAGCRVIDGLKMVNLGSNNSLHYDPDYKGSFAHYVLDAIGNNGDTINFFNGMIAYPGGGYVVHKNGRFYLRGNFVLDTWSNGNTTLSNAYYNSTQMLINDNVASMLCYDQSNPAIPVILRQSFNSSGILFKGVKMDGTNYSGTITALMDLETNFNALIN